MKKKIEDITKDYRSGRIGKDEYSEAIDRAVKALDYGLEDIGRSREVVKIVKEKEKAQLYQDNAVITDEQEASMVASGFKMVEYIKTLYRANHPKQRDFQAEKRLSEWNQKATLVEGTDNLGGYLVPEELYNDIVTMVAEDSIASRYMRVFPMKSDKKRVPTEETGVSVAFHDEGEEAAESNPTFGSALLEAKRLDAYSITSNEFLEDEDIGIASFLLSQFTKAAGQKIDSAVFTASGDPVSGVFTANAGYSQILEGGEVNFSSVVTSDLIDLYHKVPSYGRKEGIFVMHPDVIAYFQKEVDSQGGYMLPPYQAGGDSPKIHGRYPLLESEQCPDSTGADTAFIAFGNFRYMALGRRRKMKIAIDPYSHSTKFQTIMVVSQRVAFAWLKTGAFSRLLTASS